MSAHQHRSPGTSRVTCGVCQAKGPKATLAHDETWIECSARAEELAEAAGFVLVPLPHAQRCAWVCPSCFGVFRGLLGARAASSREAAE